MKSSNLAKYKSKNPLKRLFLKRFLENLGETISPLKIDSVLDAGCGEGFTISYLSKIYPNIIFSGIDFSQTAIDIAKKNNPKISFKTGSIYSLPYTSSSFDLVICSEVLEHLDNPEKALTELQKVSKKYLLLSVPNEPLFSLSSLLSGQYLSRLGKHPEHVNFWSKKDFVSLLKERFCVNKIETSFPWTIVLCSIKG